MLDNGMIYFARTVGATPSKEEVANMPSVTASSPDFLGKICLRPDRANRHGFICGATGTGKSVTLKVLAESFSQLGVPVIMSDVKGDMAGIAAPGEDNENMRSRIQRFGLSDCFKFEGYPVSIFDIYRENGTPLRTTVSEMGPLLLSQILDLNETQTELMQVIFKIADDSGLLLTDTKDVKATLQYCAEHSSDFQMDYGYIPQQSVASIIRAIVALESEEAGLFFGEPTIDIRDFFLTSADGRGIINILDAETLINKPRLYSAFMLYLLSELFEVLPEVGDLDKPKMVFFFDEAHLLFKNAPKSLLEKVEQVIKLIRSKGVSIFFVTQSPGDIPDAVMAQLSNKIEHGLHAYTPAEQKVVNAAAEAFRTNPAFDTESLLMNLGTGEAIVSMLSEDGAPSMAEHVYVLPPESRMGTLTPEERAMIVEASPLNAKYSVVVDDVSAYEVITGKVAGSAASSPTENAQAESPAGINTDISSAASTIGDYAGPVGESPVQAEGEQAAQPAQEAVAQAGTEAPADKAASKSNKSDEKSTSAVRSIADNFLGKSGTNQVVRSTGGTIGREVGKVIGEAILGKKGKTIGGNIGSALGRNLFGTLLKK